MKPSTQLESDHGRTWIKNAKEFSWINQGNVGTLNPIAAPRSK
jgi:hypothetical protein